MINKTATPTRLTPKEHDLRRQKHAYETRILIKNDTGKVDQVFRISSKENSNMVEIEYTAIERPFSGYRY
jgi:hypothetical protein